MGSSEVAIGIVASWQRNDGVMRKSAAGWVGGGLILITATAMGVYFASVGLDEADKLASTIGAFIGLAGLALAIYGTVGTRRRSPLAPDSPTTPGPHGAVHNEIHGGTFHGPTVQGRDFGRLPSESPSRPARPLDGSGTSVDGGR